MEVIQMDGEWPFDDADGNGAFDRLFQNKLAKYGNQLLQNNEFLNSRNAAGTGNIGLIRANATDNTEVHAEANKEISFTVDETEVAKIDADSITAPLYLFPDATRINHSVLANAAGTAYSLTATSAALDFGTTDPAITINRQGRYILFPRVNLKYNAATFSAARDVTLKLRRTNNTPADLSNSSTVIVTDIITTLTYTLGVIILPPVVYNTSNTDDIITIFGDVSVLPDAGSLDAVQASILALRIDY